MANRKNYYSRKFWKTLPPASYTILLMAIFFIFSSLGFVVDIFNAGRMPGLNLAAQVFFSGVIAICYVHTFTRNWKFFPLILIVHVAFVFIAPKGQREISGAALETRLVVDGLGVMMSMILGYIFFVIFISREGRKQFLLQAEMDLARGMHEILVPDVRFHNRELEIYGRSIPAEEVGGDLLDVYQGDDSLTAYIADVSGHGVASGLLMGMFKSAMYANLQKNLPFAEVLNEANRTLYRLKKRTMFLTCAGIRFSGDQTAEFSVAGHLPILHYRAQSGSIEQLRGKQIPLSVQADYRFTTQQVSYSPGDCFALVTDGLSEAADQKDNEFGLERIENLLRENQQQPLEKLFDIVLAAVNDHGPRKDDQTLMFIRCL